MELDKVGVHRVHCCALHGCKYGDDSKCPVCNRDIGQDYVCEACMDSGISDLGILWGVVLGSVKTCDHCGHVHP